MGVESTNPAKEVTPDKNGATHGFDDHLADQTDVMKGVAQKGR